MAIRLVSSSRLKQACTKGEGLRAGPEAGRWRSSGSEEALSRIEVLREQYQNGTLSIDEYEVARSILMRVLT